MEPPEGPTHRGYDSVRGPIPLIQEPQSEGNGTEAESADAKPAFIASKYSHDDLPALVASATPSPHSSASKSKAPVSRRKAPSQRPPLGNKREWWIKSQVFPPGRKECSEVDIVIVYLFNSRKHEGTRHGDVEMNLFKHRNVPVRRKVEHEYPHAMHGKHDGSRERAPSTRASANSESSSQALGGRSNWETACGRLLLADPQLSSDTTTCDDSDTMVDWLLDRNILLLGQIRNSRVIFVGFDVGPMLDTPLDIRAAGSRLCEELISIRSARSDPPGKPVLLMGHGYGSGFILQALVQSIPGESASHELFRHTAGVLMIASPHFDSARSLEYHSRFLGISVDEEIFADLRNESNTAVELLHYFWSEAIAQRPRREWNRKQKLRRPQYREPRHVSFPITCLVNNEEQPCPRDELARLVSLLPITIERYRRESLKLSDPRDSSFQHIVALLRTALDTYQLLEAAAAKDVDRIEIMIRDGIDVNLKNPRKQSALHIAVEGLDECMVRVLLHRGNADPNITDYGHNTPLHDAVTTDNDSIIQHLVDRGADINFQNRGKETPYELAQRRQHHGKILKILRSKLISGLGPDAAGRRIGENKPPVTIDGLLVCEKTRIAVTEHLAPGHAGECPTHWSISFSVRELLYGPKSLQELLSQVRPKDAMERSPICVWLHIPDNNMIWVEDLFIKLGIHDSIWGGGRAMPFRSIHNRAITPHMETLPNGIVSIFAPYVSYESNVRQAKWRPYIEAVDRLNQYPQYKHVRPRVISREPFAKGRDNSGKLQMGDFEDDLDEVDQSTITAYLNDPPALHIRRTLDQYSYHMLRCTARWDQDQVVSRWARRWARRERVHIHNILMVDQLWLWMHSLGQSPAQASTQASSKYRPEYVITAFPERTEADYLNRGCSEDIKSQVLASNKRLREPICTMRDLGTRILFTCFNVFDRFQDRETLQFFHMFEDSVRTIDDNESSLFGEFQSHSTALHELGMKSRNFGQRKRMLMEQLLDIREETRSLVEIKDIRDEIHIILSVFHSQLSVLDRLVGEESNKNTNLGPFAISNAVERLIQNNITDFTKLDNQAELIQDKLNTLLDLKQKASNAWEARSARECALEAAKQGNTMMVFTVVTIIFLPLSFMASFFALNITAFPQDEKSGESSWPLGLLSAYLFGIAIAISVPLIIIAMNVQHFSNLWQRIRNDYFILLQMTIIQYLPGFRPESPGFKKLEERRDAYLNEQEELENDQGLHPEKA